MESILVFDNVEAFVSYDSWCLDSIGTICTNLAPRICHSYWVVLPYNVSFEPCRIFASCPYDIIFWNRNAQSISTNLCPRRSILFMNSSIALQNVWHTRTINCYLLIEGFLEIINDCICVISKDPYTAELKTFCRAWSINFELIALITSWSMTFQVIPFTTCHCTL